MKRFTRSFVNELVSYADRYYTYDTRELKREGDDTRFDFTASNYETNTHVCIDVSKFGIFVRIARDGKTIYSDILKTFAEVTTFKQMILCLG